MSSTTNNIITVTVFIIYLRSTSYFVNAEKNTRYHPCIRTCVENQAMTCHYHFTVEHYVTMGKACEYCYPNTTEHQLLEIPDCQCVLGNGIERGILTINRMLPGPSIQVCKGDTIIVDVHNRMEGQSTAFHWHGLHLRDYQYNDGVPFITQCPILGGTSYRYKFKAETSGTHFYHSHANVQLADGLYGSLIVREPSHRQLNHNLYDLDLPQHVILVSNFLHFMGSELLPGYLFPGTSNYPESFLINGLGKYSNLETREETQTPYQVYTVEAGKRYRFRIINSIGGNCEARIVVQDHPLTLIASDGVDYEPVTVDTIVSFPGERFDVVINANRPPGAYWIQIRSVFGCLSRNVYQLAILRYEGQSWMPSSPKPTYKNPLPERKTYVDICGPREDQVCVTDLRTKEASESNVITELRDDLVSLSYSVIAYENPSEIFKSNTYQHFLFTYESTPITSTMLGISFVFPPFPPLSQSNDLRNDTLCTPPRGKVVELDACSGGICHCPHTMHFALGDTVDFILVDTSNNNNTMLPHPYHLHGHSFYVMAYGHLKKGVEYSMRQFLPIMKKYQRDLKEGRIRQPAKRDTLLIPLNGYAIIRVKFDNPGYWFFHCHFTYHPVIGMSLIFHVGNDTDLPPVPHNFPRCGNFLE